MSIKKKNICDFRFNGATADHRQWRETREKCKQLNVVKPRQDHAIQTLPGIEGSNIQSSCRKDVLYEKNPHPSRCTTNSSYWYVFFFQYFINLPDSEVETYLKLFTFMTKREIHDCLANMRVSIFFSITVKQAFVVVRRLPFFMYIYLHVHSCRKSGKMY